MRYRWSVKSQLTRSLGEIFASMAALALLLAILVAIDGRVQQQLTLRMSGAQAQTELRAAGAQLRSMTSVIVDAVRFQAIEHAPLVFLVVTGCVLVIFMLRT